MSACRYTAGLLYTHAPPYDPQGTWEESVLRRPESQPQQPVPLSLLLFVWGSFPKLGVVLKRPLGLILGYVGFKFRVWGFPELGVPFLWSL